MNIIQKLIVLTGVGVITLTGIYPPWVWVVPVPPLDQNLKRVVDGGYALISSPPSLQYRELPYTATIDLRRLGVQWVMVVVATVGLLLIFKGGNRADSAHKNT